MSVTKIIADLTVQPCEALRKAIDEDNLDHLVVDEITIGRMPRGMRSGRPSVMLIVERKGGRVLVLEAALDRIGDAIDALRVAEANQESQN